MDYRLLLVLRGDDSDSWPGSLILQRSEYTVSNLSLEVPMMLKKGSEKSTKVLARIKEGPWTERLPTRKALAEENASMPRSRSDS